MEAKELDERSNSSNERITHKDKTTIAFHIEKLLSVNQREEAKAYWSTAIKTITEQITTNC